MKQRKPASREEHARRMYVYGHNSLLGAAALARQNMQRVLDSPSTTEGAKYLARRIKADCTALGEALKTRIDP